VRLFRRHPVWGVLVVVAAIGVALVGFSAITVWRAAHHDGAADVERADAIVVLGAAQYDGTPSPVFQGRLDHAALLWEQGRADVVFTVGSKLRGDRFTEAEAGRRYLIEQGVPADRVVALEVGHTTFDSLRAAARAMRERDMTSAYLVSDPWHNARITAMAGDLGLVGAASATWTSADASQESRGRGYLRETLALALYCTQRLFQLDLCG
jgi:vancomycin permeability regulator SanA